MRKKTLNIETVHQCNCRLGNKTAHPLVSTIDLSKAKWTDYSVTFNFYTVLLIENKCNDFIYGRKYYDYSNATLVFLTPGQPLQMDESRPLPQHGWLLAFHPHFICGTTLGENIDSYTFFSYQPDEALHLSLREKNKAIECFTSIEQELRHAIDRHSQTIISRYIELLLDYCARFYERQFITHDEVNQQIMNKVEWLLDEYIQSGQLRSKVPPSVAYCSDTLHLSPQYFSDLVKFETGGTPDEYFQLKRIETAKKMLLNKDYTMNQIAEALGFPNTQSFRNLFEKITGVTPDEYGRN